MTGSASRLSRALAMAEEVHEGVVRKGTDIPYLAHVVGVSALVMEFGGNEDEAIAGLLHDTIEDGGDPRAIRAQILDQFGPRVLEIVEAMTDAAPEPGEEKPPWRERKEAYVAHLAGCDDAGVHRVCLSDKLYNLRAINSDLAEIGDAVWKRSRPGPRGRAGTTRNSGGHSPRGRLRAVRSRWRTRRRSCGSNRRSDRTDP